MLRIDSLGLEWEDSVPALVLTEDEGHYRHLRTGKLFSRSSIDEMQLDFAPGELGSEAAVPAPEPEPEPEPETKVKHKGKSLEE